MKYYFSIVLANVMVMIGWLVFIIGVYLMLRSGVDNVLFSTDSFLVGVPSKVTENMIFIRKLTYVSTIITGLLIVVVSQGAKAAMQIVSNTKKDKDNEKNK